MTSSPLNNKKLAVIQFEDDQSILVTPPNNLENFARKWTEDSTLWPAGFTAVFLGNIDRLCKILLMDFQEECEKFKNEWLEKSRKKSLEENAFVSVREHNLLKVKVDNQDRQIKELRELVLTQGQQLNELHNAVTTNICDSKMYKVGTHKLPVSLYQLMIARNEGLNATGFNVLARTIIGADNLNGNWKSLGTVTQTKVKDLLNCFVVVSMTREMKASPKPSLLEVTYKKIYSSYTTMLNNQKYTSKQKNNKGNAEEITEESVSEEITDDSVTPKTGATKRSKPQIATKSKLFRNATVAAPKPGSSIDSPSLQNEGTVDTDDSDATDTYEENDDEEMLSAFK